MLWRKFGEMWATVVYFRVHVVARIWGMVGVALVYYFAQS